MAAGALTARSQSLTRSEVGRSGVDQRQQAVHGADRQPGEVRGHAARRRVPVPELGGGLRPGTRHAVRPGPTRSARCAAHARTPSPRPRRSPRRWQGTESSGRHTWSVASAEAETIRFVVDPGQAGDGLRVTVELPQRPPGGGVEYPDRGRPGGAGQPAPVGRQGQVDPLRREPDIRFLGSARSQITSRSGLARISRSVIRPGSDGASMASRSSPGTKASALAAPRDRDPGLAPRRRRAARTGQRAGPGRHRRGMPACRRRATR